MTTEAPRPSERADLPSSVEIETPQATIAPLMLSLGLAMMAMGAITSLGFLIVGSGVCIIAVGLWVGHILPGRGYIKTSLIPSMHHTELVSSELRDVQHLHMGMPGYRLRLPMEIHPISAGIRGGIVGGLVMPIPAFAYGIISGHGIWYPVNMLTGMVLPGVELMTPAKLEEFQLVLLLLAIFIHGVMSVVLGLVYGVLLPTLPPIPKPLAWGGLLMPLLWSSVSFVMMGSVNPVLAEGVDWSWFIASQFVFGIMVAFVFMNSSSVSQMRCSLLGGLIGGLLMPFPALLWSLASGHGFWYPGNLLAGLVLAGLESQSPLDLMRFHASWLLAAIIVHIVMSTSFCVIYGWLLPMLRPIPGPLAWGGLLLPLVWTAISHTLMGVVNPLLQERVDWPWFVASQFVFGVVAAVVVMRSELIYITPAGSGPLNVVSTGKAPG